MTIVHHEGRCTESEVLAAAQTVKTTGTTEEDTSHSNICHKTTKNINELVAPFEEVALHPYMILIEGAPGIGKTILSKEIAFQWAHKIILNNKRLLFLLFLRDPQIKNIISVKSFVNHYCQSDSLTNKITEWLIETHGEYLTIILDGYDEMCENNKNCFIVDGIIGRQKLPKCGIIITSRPAATAHLHDVVSCRAEVLGFTEEDRQNFIHNALVDQTDKIEELGHFLTKQSISQCIVLHPLKHEHITLPH